MGHFCNKNLFLCLPQILSHQRFPIGNAQGFRKEARAEGISGSFPLPNSGYRQTLPASTTSQSLLSLGGMVTSSGVTFLICSSESHSGDQCPEEKSSSRCRTSHSYFPYLAFICWRDGFWTRCMYLFPNHWVSILLTPLFEEPFSWCFSADVFPM